MEGGREGKRGGKEGGKREGWRGMERRRDGVRKEESERDEEGKGGRMID